MSYDAEQNVIGSLIQRPELLDDVCSFLIPEMFKDEFMRNAYSEFLRGKDNNYKVDLPVLLERMPNDSYPREMIAEILRNAMVATLTTATFKSFAVTLSNEYRASQLMRVVQDVRGHPDTVNEDIEALSKAIESLRLNDTSKLKSLAEITEENKDKYFIDDGKPKIMTGMQQLDEILGGFDGGDLVLIGARPAVGKSAFASQLSMYFAEQLHLKVGYFNLEMQEKQIYERFVAMKSGIEITRIRRATRYLDDEEERFRKANEYLMTVKDIVISTGSKKISDIRSECRGQNFGVIIIDYLQLIKSDGSYKGNRYAEVGQISHSAKALAMDMNIPVIALCQLNRTVEGRETKEPSMSDLRESGDFEQDASTILMLWNTNKDDRSEKCIKVEKQRQGKNGRVNLKFDGNRMKFTEVWGHSEKQHTPQKETYIPRTDDGFVSIDTIDDFYGVFT